MGGASGVHVWNNHACARAEKEQQKASQTALPNGAAASLAPITPVPPAEEEIAEVKRSSVRFSISSTGETERLSAVCMPNTIEREIFSPREEGDGLLAGEWVSGGGLWEKIVVVKGEWATWPNTGRVRRRALLTEQFGESSAGASSARLFSLTLRGRKYSGTVSRMGGAILWDDGDVWVRGIGRMASARKCEKESASAMAHYYVDNVLAPPLIGCLGLIP